MERIKKTGIKGFSLVEIIVVIGILVLIGGIVAGILVVTLRSSSKSSITNTVSQNGNYALSVVTDIINSSNSILELPEGVGITDCAPPTPPPSGPSIKLGRIDGGITVLSCALDTISSNSASLIDTTQVKIDSANPLACSFTCSQTDVFSVPIIEVNMLLQQKQTTSFFERRGEARFKTSVSLRNYSPRKF